MQEGQLLQLRLGLLISGELDRAACSKEIIVNSGACCIRERWMTKIEKRLFIYSTNSVIEFAFFLAILFIAKIFNSWIAYLVLLVVLISILIDICRCFLSIKAVKKLNYLLVLSFSIAALDILSTLFAVDFNLAQFKTHESNMLFIQLLSEKIVFISILCSILLKLIIHVVLITSAKTAVFLIDAKLIQPRKLQDYTFKEYFWYLRSTRYITEPIDYIKNHADEPLNNDFAFSILAASKSEIIIFTLFYLIIVLNNIFAFMVNNIGAEPRERLLLKMIIYVLFAILLVGNPIYAFKNTEKNIMRLLAEETRYGETSR